jgi:hypothetical protein
MRTVGTARLVVVAVFAPTMVAMPGVPFTTLNSAVMID